MDNPGMVLTQSSTDLILNVSDTVLHADHEQFERLCQLNPDLRLELTSTGELIIMAPVGLESSKRNGDLTAQVIIWNRRRKLGDVFDSSGGFTLPSGAVRSPDVTWISHSKLNTISLKVTFPIVVPDFVIELRSRTDRLKTLQEKMLEYQENGVLLGWLINPQDREVEIYRLGQDVEILKSPSELSGEDVLPNFILDLTTIW
jgi:Uma2 family endonuclease